MLYLVVFTKFSIVADRTTFQLDIKFSNLVIYIDVCCLLFCFLPRECIPDFRPFFGHIICVNGGVVPLYYIKGWDQNPQKIPCSCDADRVGAVIFLHMPLSKAWRLLFLSINSILWNNVSQMPIFPLIWIFMVLGGDFYAHSFFSFPFRSSSKADVTIKVPSTAQFQSWWLS